MHETVKVYRLVGNLFEDVAYMHEYFLAPLSGLPVASISDAPGLYEFALPFYATDPDADNRQQAARQTPDF
jgi:hypothetical protein